MEIEFSDEEAFYDFRLPPQLALHVEREVTEDEIFKNKNLALFGLPVHSGQAVVMLMKKLRQLYKKICFYHTKVIANGKDENLHQFRVALRTSVSLLGSCRFLCSGGICDDFKKGCKEIISVTNAKRDLDVMRSGLEEYAGELKSALLQKAFDTLQEEVSKKAKEEEERIVSFLQSDLFHEVCRRYEGFIYREFQSYKSFYGHYALLPVCNFVVLKHFQKIKKSVRSLHAGQDMERMHKLRIEFKKMRYLLENFRKNYPEAEMKQLIRSVKKLQNFLGGFHDLYQQKLIFESLLKEQQDTSVIFLLENSILPQIDLRLYKEMKRVDKRVQKFLKQEVLYRKLFS